MSRNRILADFMLGRRVEIALDFDGTICASVVTEKG